MQVATAAAESFTGWVEHWDGTGQNCQRNGLLQEYLLAWLECGDGIYCVGGDFSIFMQAVVIIIQKWLDDPAILDLRYAVTNAEGRAEEKVVTRRALSVFDVRGQGALCFEPDFFEKLAFDKTLGRIP